MIRKKSTRKEMTQEIKYIYTYDKLYMNRCYPELGKCGFSPAIPGVQTNFYR